MAKILYIKLLKRFDNKKKNTILWQHVSQSFINVNKYTVKLRNLVNLRSDKKYLKFLDSHKFES